MAFRNTDCLSLGFVVTVFLPARLLFPRFVQPPYENEVKDQSASYRALYPGPSPHLKWRADIHRGQTSEAFFVLFSGILFNVMGKDV